MQHLAGFRSLADRYDGFIVDLWGVIHDGITPYPGAINCLTQLRDAGKKAVLLSNAPRRADVVQHVLRQMGIADNLYAGIMTSGQYCRSLLSTRQDPWFAGIGRRMLHLGAPKDINLFEGLDLDIVTDPAQADFMLNTGPNEQDGEGAIAPYQARLDACLQAGLPMLCANPDLEVIRGGKRLICAGLLAKFYEYKGGRVRWIGKPYPEVYAPVMDMLGLAPDRVLAVGDALATDMRGAANSGIDGCWVLGGIHLELIGDDSTLADDEAAKAGLSPVASVPGFFW